LDSGSSSRIYSAKPVGISQTGLLDEFAVKYLCPKEIEFLHHMDQEMTALAKLGESGTPGVVRAFYASGLQAEGCRYIVLTRTGKDLDRFVSSSDDFNSVLLDGFNQTTTGRLSVEAFAASVGLILIEILGNVHATGVAHNDIFPYNVALSYPLGDEPVLIDFGGAVFQDSVPEESFTAHTMDDEIQLVKLVSWIVHQRISREFGKARRDELKARSIFVRSVEDAKSSEHLARVLLQYLQATCGIEWTSGRRKIIFMEAP
jgi:serine/threonine protein kinase